MYTLTNKTVLIFCFGLFKTQDVTDKCWLKDVCEDCPIKRNWSGKMQFYTKIHGM